MCPAPPHLPTWWSSDACGFREPIHPPTSLSKSACCARRLPKSCISAYSLVALPEIVAAQILLQILEQCNRRNCATLASGCAAGGRHRELGQAPHDAFSNLEHMWWRRWPSPPAWLQRVQLRRRVYQKTRNSLPAADFLCREGGWTIQGWWGLEEVKGEGGMQGDHIECSRVHTFST